jgi:hypothetical protein
MTAATRIKFVGLQSGVCCCGRGIDATIDRQYPSILQDTSNTNVSQLSWMAFCDQIDAALKPISTIKRRLARIFTILFVLMVLATIGVSTLITQTPIETYLGKLWYMYVFLVLYIVPCFTFLRTRGVLSRQMQDIYDEIRMICLNTSNQYLGVTFRYQMIRQSDGSKSWYLRYIEITVASNDDITVPTDGYASDTISTSSRADAFEENGVDA